MDCFSKYLSEDGFYRFSASKTYNISETAFTKFLSHRVDDNVFLTEGRNLANQMRKIEVPNEGLAIEIGCGTGRLSGALALSGFFNMILVTDASEELLRETKLRIESIKGVDLKKTKFGVMSDHDVVLLQNDSVQAIFLAATLHHFVDWKGFLLNVKRVLKRGGIIYCSDPCLEFSLTMSVLLLSFKQICQSNNYKLQEEELRRINNFIGASKLRGNPFASGKENSEDKHLFKVADIYKFAHDNDMKLYIFPDSSLYRFMPYGEPHTTKLDFNKHIRTILTRTQHFPESLCDKFMTVMKEQITYLEYFWEVGRGPYSNFISILQKK